MTGLISTGKGNDTVYMDSGSKVIGGFSGVTSLSLNINDATQKNNVMWQASGITSQTYTSISVEFGLLGDFKIISKSNDIDWTKLFSNSQFDAMQNNLVKGNELYTYGEGTAVNVTYSSDGKIAMELGGIDATDRLPNDHETSVLCESMEQFCDDFKEIEKRLLAKGVVLASRISMLPPSAEYAQIINTTDYNMIEITDKLQAKKYQLYHIR